VQTAHIDTVAECDLRCLLPPPAPSNPGQPDRTHIESTVAGFISPLTRPHDSTFRHRSTVNDSNLLVLRGDGGWGDGLAPVDSHPGRSGVCTRSLGGYPFRPGDTPSIGCDADTVSRHRSRRHTHTHTYTHAAKSCRPARLSGSSRRFEVAERMTKERALWSARGWYWPRRTAVGGST